MKTLKPQKRSTSPFGLTPPEADPLEPLKTSYANFFGPVEPEKKPPLKIWEDGKHIANVYESVYKAPANESQGLGSLCQFLVKYRENLEENNLADLTYQYMMDLFNAKTELFLVDHFDKEACEKMEWDDLHRDMVLFQKERDTLIGQFFAPYSEHRPGEFADFVDQWVETSSFDRLLHFVDFCRGSKNPTFEYYLLFTSPALSRWVEDKKTMRSLFDKTIPLLKRISSPTWEQDIRKALEL